MMPTPAQITMLMRMRRRIMARAGKGRIRRREGRWVARLVRYWGWWRGMVDVVD
jgi:hypothetical protein